MKSKVKKIAIIGASYLQLPLIEKAKVLNIETHVFAWQADDVGEDVADYFYPISIVEKDKILKKCKKIGIDGICSIASDLAMITVNYVAMNMGLIGNSIESTNKSTNKHLMRKCFEINGDPSPKSIKVDLNTMQNDININYPIIVKPVDRSGSRGVSKLYSNESIEKAIKYAIEESFRKEALIEEFVEGDEYSVEYISWEGIHTFLQLTKKFTTDDGRFIETAHLEPAPINDEILLNIKRVVERALTSLGIRYGASHSEIKINEKNEIKIIEIGARMGGDLIGSDLVYYSTGIDYVKAVIDVALNQKPNLIVIQKPIKVKSVYMFTKSDFDELEKLKSIVPSPIIKIVDYHPEKIGQTTDSSNRCGCYIMKV